MHVSNERAKGKKRTKQNVGKQFTGYIVQKLLVSMFKELRRRINELSENLNRQYA